VGRPRPTEHRTGPAPPDDGGELVHCRVEHAVDYSSLVALLEISSKSACTFPWTSITASA
jgi:hypothetical protein